MNRQYLALFTLTFGLLASAEDRREQYSSAVDILIGSGGNGGNDRKRDYGNAAETLQKGNQNQLEPQKMMHNMKAVDHFKRADQARQNKDEGTASSEEKMGMMEQMKSQQMQQQINQNSKAASENSAREALVSRNTEGSQGAQKGYEANVTSLRNESIVPVSNESAPAAVSKEVADLASVVSPEARPSEPVTAETIEPVVSREEAASEQKANAMLGNLEKMDRGISTSTAKTVAPPSQMQTRLLSSALGNPTEGSSTTNIWELGSGNNLVEEKEPLLPALPGQESEKKRKNGALDSDFFADCPTFEKLGEAREKNEPVKMSARCKSFVQRCSKEVDASANPKLSVEVSEDCRKWKTPPEQASTNQRASR